jgi:hypothetical protein
MILSKNKLKDELQIKSARQPLAQTLPLNQGGFGTSPLAT